ncbi:hypothetical protein SUGI_0441280 [Cryptomeria japonica]|uniref:small ribosomal subunit protein cS22 n=1 Tax=Cryptomeria japonica TaxID=3369 RepID=UPI002408E194|nr:small ribosomal subunit protein cS22 [Cryptomeria japonica]GLJ23323.1 hypothetical protein SUGI_0441280 [Cryptomeria japonica]
MAAAYLSIAPTASAHTHMPKQFSTPKFITASRLPFTSIPTTSPCRPLSTLNHKKVLRIIAQVQVQEASVSGKQKEEFERKLYVGNIPRTCTNEELGKIFAECGAVEKAEVMYDKYTRRSRRFGFVTMSTVEDAQAAAEKLNGTEIGGREIKVNVTEKPLDMSTLNRLTEEVPFIESPYKVYVGNLAKTVTTETLKNKFSEKGNVLDAKVVCIPQTRKSCGYGFVSFSSEADMQAAISSFSNAELEGKRMSVNVA